MIELDVKVHEKDIIGLDVKESQPINVSVTTHPVIETAIYGTGPRGKNGVGVPEGGEEGDVLLKRSNANHDTYWGKNVHLETTEYWNSQPTLIGRAGHIYVYTDYDVVDGKDIPAIKIGDGLSYLIDNPFIASNSSEIEDHINNTTVHITAEERAFWNAKMRGYVIEDDEEVIFTTN